LTCFIKILAFKNVICNSKLNKPSADYEYVSYDLSSASSLEKLDIPSQQPNTFFQSLYGSPILPARHRLGQKLTSTQILHEQTARLVNSGYYENYEKIYNHTDDFRHGQEEQTYASQEYSDYEFNSATSGSCSCFSSSAMPTKEQNTVNYSSIMTSDYSSLNTTSDCSSNSASTTTPNNKSNEDIFICHTDYKAKLDGDLSLKCFDKVKMIVLTPTDPTGNSYVLVQLISNGALGYVPRKCLISLKEYLKSI
jgi:hypothetical protein